MGGVVKAIETGALKAKLVESNTRRLEAIERGEQIVVGVNAFTNSEPSPLTAGENAIMVPSAEAEAEQIARLKAWRASANEARVRQALQALRAAAASGANIMPASIEAAKAGVTTGEWGDALRAEFGEFRAPTGVSPQARQEAAGLDALRGEVERVSLKLGRRIRFLIGKPGLDGHSNGAEQIAARATDAGMDVDLRRHPLHPGGNRRARQIRRPLHRPVDPVGLARAADGGSPGATCARRAWRTCPWSSAASSRPPTPIGCSRPAWRRSIPRRISKSTPCSAP